MRYALSKYGGPAGDLGSGKRRFFLLIFLYARQCCSYNNFDHYILGNAIIISVHWLLLDGYSSYDLSDARVRNFSL